MTILLATLIALLALCTGMALHYYLSLRQALVLAEAERAELRALMGQRGDGGMPTAEPYIRMIVEVKNPIELAHRESPVAKIASGTAPNLVIKKVYEQVVAQTKDELKQKNVDADVRIIVL